jgi:hypothetical protein
MRSDSLLFGKLDGFAFTFRSELFGTATGFGSLKLTQWFIS